MFDLNLLRDAKIERVSDAVVAGTTLITTSVVDTQGYNSVAFIVLLGTVTDASDLTLSAKTNTVNATTGANVATSADTVALTAATSSNGMLILDVNKPRQQYAFATLARATQNAAIDGILAVLYNAQEHPVTQDATQVLASTSTNDSV